MTLPPPAQQLVDGKLVGASDGMTYPILNPATGAEIGQAPDATSEDVEAAIAAARRAVDEELGRGRQAHAVAPSSGAGAVGWVTNSPASTGGGHTVDGRSSGR